MELKEGMYVRTKNGMKIGKIVKIHKAVNHKSWYELKNGLRIYSYEEINEPSHNITDLIEVGDYVNGHKIDRVDEPCKLNPYGSLKYHQNEDYDYDEILGNEIKSIVTKEQFESVSYRLEN